MPGGDTGLLLHTVRRFHERLNHYLAAAFQFHYARACLRYGKHRLCHPEFQVRLRLTDENRRRHIRARHWLQQPDSAANQAPETRRGLITQQTRNRILSVLDCEQKPDFIQQKNYHVY
jgi:hypothetical protein